MWSTRATTTTTSWRCPPTVARPAVGGTFGEAWGSGALPTNTWTHLAVSYDRVTLRLYINGVQAASTPYTGAIATSANPLQIGGDSIYGQYFQGLIDEVRVYNRALTPAEIQTDMNTAIGGGSGPATPSRPRWPSTRPLRRPPSPPPPVR